MISLSKSLSVPIYPSVVLVIDDDPLIQRQIQLCLEAGGHKVILASNGVQGLLAYQNDQPDLILLDAVMPGMDGFECCRKILADPHYQDTPILMVTGLEAPQYVDLAFEVGAVDYITKPIHWAVLRQRVKRLIYQNRLQQQLAAANQLLEQLVTVDELTQISNRRHFDQFLAQEWWRCFRQKEHLSLILADVDYFKLYNDTYGHLAGDSCLYRLSQTMRRQVRRPSDLVARYGGEEFAVILPQTDLKGATNVAEKILKAVRNLQIPHHLCPVNPSVTLSLGVACLCPDFSLEPEMLIEKADQALFQAKKQGRNQVSF